MRSLRQKRAERRLAGKSITATVNCSHIDSIHFTQLPENIAGCEECLASGDWWVHLRMCQSCGHIGCCDESPNRHATAPARETSHPIIAPPSLARTGATATSTTSPSSSADDASQEPLCPTRPLLIMHSYPTSLDGVSRLLRVLGVADVSTFRLALGVWPAIGPRRGALEHYAERKLDKRAATSTGR